MAPPSPMGPGWVRGLNYTRHTPLRARLAPFLAVFSDSYERPQRPGVGTARDLPGRGRLGRGRVAWFGCVSKAWPAGTAGRAPRAQKQ